ncbi:hypothetical protein DEO23_10570 [Brachybacterium endophyticum]|uniref:Uncharacterized protein n=1 Tax=Brachybacterium endophyticum TaxID=2182385 RepID=A0A2U2RID9_9MICO|nr:hypothetical protein DEO23_10570 [Brachybacterium endophyticum]
MLEVAHRDADREVLLVERAGDVVVRVRALSDRESQRLHLVAGLLTELNEIPVRAAPRLLDAGGGGLLLERSVPLRSGSGRRRAEAHRASPSSAERRALVTAREDLDALVDALHGRGWGVGLAPGGGLGTRRDGSVVLADLRGLAPGPAGRERLADQHWVDSVLEDQDRTLRRRIDQGPAAGPRSEADGPRPAGSARADPEPLGRGILGPESIDHRHRAAPSARPRSRNGERSLAGRRRGGHPPVPRRLALVLAGGLLVLAGGATALAMGSEHRAAEAPHPGTATGADHGTGPGATRETRSGTSAGPRGAVPRSDPAGVEASITDPREFAQELATMRHGYVTGAGEESAALPGSPAADQDDQVRDAYADAQVAGEGPQVTGAVLEKIDDEEGTARLRVSSEQGELRVRMPDGVVRVRAAHPAAEIRLELERGDDGAWRVREVDPV